MSTSDVDGDDKVLAALAFLHAVRTDAVERAAALLAEHPDLPTLSIRTACAAGDLASVRRWLDADPSLATHTIPPDFTPPLVYAVTSAVKRARGVSADDQLQIVRLLLASGASANATVPLPDTAGAIPVLYFPAVEGNVPLARVLLEHGAHATDGESLYHAAQHDHRDVLALLLEYGADVSRGPAGVGTTPLYFLASHRTSNPIADRVRGGMQWLLEHGADPTIPLSTIGDGQPAWHLGETPLHRAAANGYEGDVLSWFVAQGAPLDAARADGATPYTLAVRSGNAAGAMWLASQGADRARLTATDRLLCACLTNDADDARALVAAHPDLIASLGDADAGALLQAISDGRDDAAQLMLSLGWPLAHEGEWGGTALHWSAWHGRVDLVQQLIDHGAPVNLRDARYGSSPLAWAAHGSTNCAGVPAPRYVTIVERLLAAGATRAEAINRWQEPPESMAHPAVTALLRERGFLDDAP